MSEIEFDFSDEWVEKLTLDWVDEWGEEFESLEEDWQVIESLLPEGWEQAAKSTGALKRARGFDSPSKLLRVLLIHLVDGCSLRETAVRASAGDLAHVSDVALLGRLRGCGEWFRWMTEKMNHRLIQASQDVLPTKKVRLVDASVITEPGATGSTWRLHYKIDLRTLTCEQVHVTLPKQGETFTRFTVQPDEVLIGDRGLAQRRGIRHVINNGGDVLVRMNLVTIPLENTKGKQFRILTQLRKLRVGQVQGWPAVMRDGDGQLDVRVCALKKNAKLTRIAQQKLLQEATKKGRTVQPETLECAGYVVVLTTLKNESAAQVLELYRHRWQIELAFKRLKSLLDLGHLKKSDEQGAKAWLQGKLFVATLIETLIAVGERFSPWGYFLSQGPIP